MARKDLTKFDLEVVEYFSDMFIEYLSKKKM